VLAGYSIKASVGNYYVYVSTYY